jgi:hypothetical protein
VQDHLPSGVALVDLGEHRLKDLDRPETIVQLVIEGIPPVFSPLKTLDDQSVDASLSTGREQELATAVEDAIAVVLRRDVGPLTRWTAAARARALDWRQFVHLPGHSRFANRLEGLGFSIHSTARIAPGELHPQLLILGRAIVTAARDARSADRLLRTEDQTVIARRLAEHRGSAYLEHHLWRADRLAVQIEALKRLAEARRQFEKEARRLEPTVRAIRARVFEARLDPATLEDLARDMRSLQQAVEELTVTFHSAYDRASKASVEVKT